MLRWLFDVAVVFWNSLGFRSRSDDLGTLRGLREVLRPGGRALFDLYHPDWLAANQLRASIDMRGATISRWLSGGRSCHEICYADGSVDRMSFNVYRPAEFSALLRAAGIRVDAVLVWWKADVQPSAEYARYQIISTPL